MTKEKNYFDGLFTQENETKKKKQRNPLYRKIHGCKLHPNVVILHTDKGPKTWGGFPQLEPRGAN